MRRLLFTFAAVLTLGLGFAIPATASPSPSPSSSMAAASALPAFTCGTNTFHLTNGGAGYAYFNNSQDRLTVENNWTDFCTQGGGVNVEIDLIGENNCLTYAGPKTGKAPLGYIDKTTCTNKVSQQWTFYSDQLLQNRYTGWCLDGPQVGGKPFMEACNVNDINQLWYPTF